MRARSLVVNDLIPNPQSTKTTVEPASIMVEFPLLPLPSEANRIIYPRYDKLLRKIAKSFSASVLPRLSPWPSTIFISTLAASASTRTR